CSQASTSAPKEEAIHIEEQASGLKQLTLSEKAAQRLGVETVPVAGSGSALTIPYAAVIYDSEGATWSYVNTAPLVYLREEITVDRIDGETAMLSAGPAAGTQVVTTGSAELYGAEIGVGGGH
ncbi:MAG: hypothetical protein L0227_10810, partial [Chloroflexi bacterium]|nr:hypothetical protein [Chloroflexota bacterium]